MNHHMNIFSFYSERDSAIENNLTRALAICLNNDPVFSFSFFSKILGPLHINPGSLPTIDIQVPISGLHNNANINIEDIRNIYPVSITSTHHFLKDEYQEIPADRTNNPTPDLVVQYEDNLIICEVKKSNENCLGQLKNQVEKVRDNIADRTKEIRPNEVPVIKDYKSLTWQETISLLESTKDLSAPQPHFLIESFYKFLSRAHPDWFPIKRLAQVNLTADNSSNIIVKKRLEIISNMIINKKKGNENNNWIPIKEEWARQFNIWLDGEDIIVACWPGYTKGQGCFIFECSKKDTWEWLSWNGEHIQVKNSPRDLTGKIEITPCIRIFPWYGDDIGSYGIYDIELAKSLFTKKNFHEHTGRSNEGDWDAVNNYFKDKLGGDWEQWSKDNWYKLNERNYSFINISMASNFYIRFKFSDISKIDTSDQGDEIIAFFEQVMNQMIDIVNANETPKH